MNTETHIATYISGLSGLKQAEMNQLHELVLRIAPGIRLWFLDGKNAEGKVVSNPNIGYGEQLLSYADGSSREFYQVGLSANTTGISVYIMGIHDKTYLAKNYGERLGKASISGYCIKFKTLKDIHTDVLEEVIKDRFENTK